MGAGLGVGSGVPADVESPPFPSAAASVTAVVPSTGTDTQIHPYLEPVVADWDDPTIRWCVCRTRIIDGWCRICRQPGTPSDRFYEVTGCDVCGRDTDTPDGLCPACKTRIREEETRPGPWL